MSLNEYILNIIRVFFPSISFKCTHDKVRPDIEQAYCPDCGKLIQNEWYITRCSCCGVKMKAMLHNGRIVPQEHYCANCGGVDYNVEKLDKINFIDIKFAVLVKNEVCEEKVYDTIKCWQEKTSEQPKLLAQYL